MERMHELLQCLADDGLTLGSVESLTGGAFATTATEHPGASAVFKGALVTYSAENKTALAGVPAQVIAQYGVVSDPVAKAMAEGGRRALGVDLCVACTGNAGPSTEPGGAEVGDVYVSVNYKGHSWTVGFRFGKNLSREQIRHRTVLAMVEFALSVIKKPEGLETKE